MSEYDKKESNDEPQVIICDYRPNSYHGNVSPAMDKYFRQTGAKRLILTPEAQEILSLKAAWLRKHLGARVTIEGHCDDRGTNEYNLALGEGRAQSARAFLMDLGVKESRMNTISYGEERPIASGQTEADWARNRRAHFVIEE